MTVTGCAIGDSDSVGGVPAGFVFSELVSEHKVPCDKFSDKQQGEQDIDGSLLEPFGGFHFGTDEQVEQGAEESYAG